jgi:hypothetical protein
MANSAISLASLDFASIKQSMKLYLSSQDRFKDYDFDGSNMSVLMDILSYNTFLNSFYLNIIGNEMFLDTATQYDSVVSHAKSLNYTPRSATSAYSTVDITITPSDPTVSSVTIPARSSFTSKVGDSAYTFSTDENIIINTWETVGGLRKFTASDVLIYEGNWVSDTFVVRPNDPTEFTLTNRSVDTSSISVVVFEDDLAISTEYSRATTLLGLSATSTVYFLQGAANQSYQITFGDDVVSARPADYSVVVVQYRTVSGSEANGAASFTSNGPIDNHTNISVFPRTRAAGGSETESLDEIKFNAPRAFQTQERAITVSDYRNMLLAAFPEINDVYAYGGETVTPAQYGKVLIAVDLKQADRLPSSAVDRYTSFIKQRCPISIDPVFLEPAYTYVDVVSNVQYNIGGSSLASADIRAVVNRAITNYSDQNLNKFNSSLKYSRLVSTIDNAQQAIISNQTTVRIIKRITPLAGTINRFDVRFDQTITTVLTDLPANSSAIASSPFLLAGTFAILVDNGAGVLNIVSAADRSVIIRRNVGSVDYNSGLLQLTEFVVDSYTDYISIYAVPRSKDISVGNNIILAIDAADVSVSVIGTRGNA